MALFAVFYEIFGHGIHSDHIRLLFLIPLIMLILCVFLKLKDVNVNLPCFTVLKMLAVSEILRHALIGIFEVYGTTYSLVTVFSCISIVLSAIFAVLLVIGLIKSAKNK